ncbi:MAG: hypothetical protein JRH19_27690, partial [Deltaproteobacteria bacterium]|nr:hypothetical protein [Deltaproteobacteria bacterium]
MRARRGEAFYSLDYANGHFIALDSHGSDRTTTGAMYTRLEADLMATSADWVIAFWHHPPYVDEVAAVALAGLLLVTG